MMFSEQLVGSENRIEAEPVGGWTAVSEVRPCGQVVRAKLFGCPAAAMRAAADAVSGAVSLPALPH